LGLSIYWFVHLALIKISMIIHAIPQFFWLQLSLHLILCNVMNESFNLFDQIRFTSITVKSEWYIATMDVFACMASKSQYNHLI
jgi:hypothetical protein